MVSGKDSCKSELAFSQANLDAALDSELISERALREVRVESMILRSCFYLYNLSVIIFVANFTKFRRLYITDKKF